MLWCRLDLNNPSEIDIDKKYDIYEIKTIIAYRDKFFVLANKHKRLLGYYLLEIDQELDKHLSKEHFVIKWVNKLDIADATLDLMKMKEK